MLNITVNYNDDTVEIDDHRIRIHDTGDVLTILDLIFDKLSDSGLLLTASVTLEKIDEDQRKTIGEW